MKVYVSGKITGLDEEKAINKFMESVWMLRSQGCKVMSPHVLIDCKDFEHEDYIHVCYAMIDVCDAIFMQKDWQDSKGARLELQYASDWHKQIIYEEVGTIDKNFPVVHGKEE